jgi:AcrR family transcriptional regulator
MTRTSRQARKASHRARLLAAAVEVFAERGYDGAGVHEIARRAGFTHGAVYSHFRSKAELLVAAIRAQTDDQFDTLLVPCDSGSAIALEEVAARLGSARSTTTSALVLEAIVAARRDPDLALLFEQQMGAHGEALGEAVTQGKDDGAIDSSVSQASLVHFWRALIMGSLVVGAIDSHQPEEGEWDALVARLVSALAVVDSR